MPVFIGLGRSHPVHVPGVSIVLGGQHASPAFVRRKFLQKPRCHRKGHVWAILLDTGAVNQASVGMDHRRYVSVGIYRTDYSIFHPRIAARQLFYRSGFGFSIWFLTELPALRGAFIFSQSNR